MKIMIAGGTGFIGRFMIPRYLSAGHHVTVVGRSAAKIQQLFDNQVSALDWNTLEQQGTDAIRAMNLIINLAGAGIAEKRWTAARKKVIIESRTKTTRLFSQLCASLGNDSPPLFNAGAVGIYGLQKSKEQGLPTAFDETEVLDFDNPPDFLSKIGRLWEAATQTAKDQGVRVVNLRFGVVLGKKGGALSQMILPFKFFIGGKIGSGQQPFSWVSIVDLCRAIDFILEKKDINGPVNLVSPSCVTQYELAKNMGQVLHKPSLMPTPGLMLQLVFGALANELLLNGQHVVPKILLAHGFEFQYPDIKSALAYALTE